MIVFLDIYYSVRHQQQVASPKKIKTGDVRAGLKWWQPSQLHHLLPQEEGQGEAPTKDALNLHDRWLSQCYYIHRTSRHH